MTPPSKKTLPENASSLVLSKDANTKLFSLLEPKTQALSTAFVSVVISRPPKHPEWKAYKTGVATLTKDHVRKGYFIQVYDIVDWERVREEELLKGTAYQVSLPTFHQMETAKGHAMGMKFSNETEARNFAQIARTITMTGLYKTDGCPAPVVINKIEECETKDDKKECTEGIANGESSGSSLSPPEPPSPANKERQPPSKPPRPPGSAAKEPSAAPLSIPEPPPVITKRKQAPSRPKRPASMAVEPPTCPPPPPPPLVKQNSANSSLLSSQTGREASSGPPPPPPQIKKNLTGSQTLTHVQKDPHLLPPPPGSSNTSATLDKKRSKKKITKDMIGTPTNFQHLYHVGFDPESGLDEKAMQTTVGDAVRRRPPPPPPPPPIKQKSSEQSTSIPLPVSETLSSEDSNIKIDEKSSDDEETADLRLVRYDEPSNENNCVAGSSSSITVQSSPAEELEQLPQANTSPTSDDSKQTDESENILDSSHIENTEEYDNSPDISLNDPDYEDSIKMPLNDISLDEKITSSLVTDSEDSVDCSVTEIDFGTSSMTLLDASDLPKVDLPTKLSDENPSCQETSTENPSEGNTIMDLSAEISKSLDDLEAHLAGEDSILDQEQNSGFELEVGMQGEKVGDTNTSDNQNTENEKVTAENTFNEHFAEQHTASKPESEEATNKLSSGESSNESNSSMSSCRVLAEPLDFISCNVEILTENQQVTSAGDLSKILDNVEQPTAPARQKRKSSLRPTPPPPPPPTPTREGSPDS